MTFNTGNGFRKRNITRALEDISLTVAKGARYGVVGESGSGKSTLARSIVGLVRPNAGEIFFDGQKIRGVEIKPKILPLKIQIVFQDPFGSLDPGQRMMSIMKEPLRVNGLSHSGDDSEDKIVQLFEKMGLSREILDRYPHQLSGGQRQRVSIARAILLRPELLILDEPTSSLDISTQAQIVELVLSLAKEYSFTYMFISHNLELVWYMCERICVMQRGRIVEIADRDEIFQNPKTEYTRQLLQAATVKT